MEDGARRVYDLDLDRSTSEALRDLDRILHQIDALKSSLVHGDDTVNGAARRMAADAVAVCADIEKITTLNRWRPVFFG